MATQLTKPQVAFLTTAMRDGVVKPAGARWVTADTLMGRGLIEPGAGLGHRVITTAGLRDLLDHWMRKDAASGCVAYQMRRAEVEAAIAAQVQA